MTTNEPAWESLDQMAQATAAGLAQAAAGSAFHLFRDKQFRRLAAIEQLSQAEQDRIFNELVVASLILIMLLLEAPDLPVAGEFHRFKGSGLASKHQDAGREPGALRVWLEYVICEF